MPSDKKVHPQTLIFVLLMCGAELGGVLGDSFWADGMRLKVQILATRKLELETASWKLLSWRMALAQTLPLESQPNHFTVTRKWKL